MVAQFNPDDTTRVTRDRRSRPDSSAGMQQMYWIHTYTYPGIQTNFSVTTLPSRHLSATSFHEVAWEVAGRWSHATAMSTAEG